MSKNFRFSGVEDLLRHLVDTGSEATIIPDMPRDSSEVVEEAKSQKAQRQKPTWTDEEVEAARRLQKAFERGDILWWVARPMILRAYDNVYNAVDFVACHTKGYMPYTYSLEHPPHERITGTKHDDTWTGAENDFYMSHLLPLLHAGEYRCVIPQVTIYMPGQTVTCDFVAFDKNGIADHYEVKGSKALGSQSRASVKYRWLKAWMVQNDSPHRVMWAQNGRVREIHVKQAHHPMLRGNKPK